MIKLIGKDIWREGKKIGWVHEPYVYDHEGKKRGYVDGHYVKDIGGHKLAYIEGDFLKTEDGKSKLRIEDITKDVEGGMMENIYRAAVMMLLGD